LVGHNVTATNRDLATRQVRKQQVCPNRQSAILSGRIREVPLTVFVLFFTPYEPYYPIPAREAKRFFVVCGSLRNARLSATSTAFIVIRSERLEGKPSIVLNITKGTLGYDVQENNTGILRPSAFVQ
jgi:hypothetical protein